MFGRVQSTHGLKGELCIECFFENYNFFIDRESLYLKDDGIFKPIKAKLTGIKKGNLIISIEECKEIEKAKALLEKEIFILRSSMENLPATQGDYYVCDIIGLEVFLEDSSESYGFLEDIVDFGGGMLLEVRLNYLHPKNIDKKEEMEYFEKKSIKAVDLSKGCVLIKND